MSFANTLREAGNFTPGAKGAKNHYTTGSGITDLQNKVIQDSTDEIVSEYFTKALADAGNPDNMMRLVITILNKRDFRKGGEGARRIFYRLIVELYNSGYKQLVIDLVKFMPDLGYYDDWPNLVKEINKSVPQTKQTAKDHLQYFEHYDPLIREIARCYFSQIDKDTTAMREGSQRVSLVGKWGARENKSQDTNLFWYMPLHKSGTNKVTGLYKQGWVNWLTRYRYLDTQLSIGTPVALIPSKCHAFYRRDLSALNRHLKTPEVLMCAKNYSEIRFENASSKFMNRSMSALLNEKRKEAPTPHEEQTGNRFPEIADRVQCRENFLEYLPNMKGAALEFYEIISKVIREKSSTKQAVLKAQWDAKVKAVRDEIAAFREELYDELLKLCAEKGMDAPPKPSWPDVIPLIDCSGSMSSAAQAPGVKSDTPLTCLLLAVSLGMGFADVNQGEFECLSISYSNDPILVDLPRSMSLKDRYYRITAIDAVSTNYLASQKLIVDYAKTHNVPQNKLPWTFCFSDEGFDQQIQGSFGYNSYYGTSRSNSDPDSAWKTTYASIQDIYQQAGYTEVPMTYFQNLSGNSRNGYQVTLTRKGVSMQQGFSSSTFKYAFVGQLPAQVAALRPKSTLVAAPAAATAPATATAADLENATKSTLDDFEAMVNRPHFDLFRCLMHFSNEGALKDYRFDKIEDFPTLPEVEDPTRSTPTTAAAAGGAAGAAAVAAMEDLCLDSPAPTAEKTWTESILGRFW